MTVPHRTSRSVGRTAVGVGIALVAAFAAAAILVFGDPDAWGGSRTLPTDTNAPGLLALVVIAVGTVVAVVVEGAGRAAGVRFGCYLVSISTAALAFALSYLRFWCDRATAVITGLIEKDQDVSHWSARVLVPGTGEFREFDWYSRDGDGVGIGDEFEVLVDPHGWSGPPSAPFPDAVLYSAAAATLTLFLVLFLLAGVRGRRGDTKGPPASGRRA